MTVEGGRMRRRWPDVKDFVTILLALTAVVAFVTACGMGLLMWCRVEQQAPRRFPWPFSWLRRVRPIRPVRSVPGLRVPASTTGPAAAVDSCLGETDK
jgi:hypothetical protein